MNLLVTNTRNAQAYAIIRALRPYSNKIVATMEGAHRLSAWLSHAARSRLVDKRYFTPSPAADWRAGRIQKENTEIEEAYIQAVLKICEKEKIDTIFPSFDPHVYVFSKNKERFEKLGILIPVPDYETVITPLDKYRTVQAAMEIGFPCPKTYLPQSEDDLKRIAKELGFPLVIKPRFTAAGKGMAMVKDFAELSDRIRLIDKSQGFPMIQEYIPGGDKQAFRLLVDKKGELKVSFSEKRHRALERVNPNFPTTMETIIPHACVTHAARLVQRVGWWGGVTVQTKVDSRDTLLKLMEINPRLGYRLWNRTELGINEPLMCLRIAKGEEVEAVKNYPVGAMLIDPIEDIVGLALKLVDLPLYKFRIGLLGKKPFDPTNPPMSLREILLSYKQTYFSGKKRVFNPYFRYFFQDPLVSILWWLQLSELVLKTARDLGR